MFLLKRKMLRNVTERVANDPTLKPKQRKAFEQLLAAGLRAFRAFAEMMDKFAEDTIGAVKASKIGDGTLFQMFLDNLDNIVAAIIKLIEALSKLS